MKNELASAQSPYLLQHKDNPVHWQTWGDEAFELAMAHDKPVFLSSGYSTCHWCHVMAHESFEDENIAAFLNEHFICIKLDREERPDIDSYYMKVCQTLTRHGGWPLTIVMTPQRRPFFAATYIPPVSQHGHRGMNTLLPAIAEAWQHKRTSIENTASRIVTETSPVKGYAFETALEKDNNLIEKTLENCFKRYDKKYGGSGNRPKFPMPHLLEFVLRHGDSRGHDMAAHSMAKMAAGGIHDHIGGGFHRYSTDRQWVLPHFEKMLYDQASFLSLLAALLKYSENNHEFYKTLIEKIFSFLTDELYDNENHAFYTAFDADSEGEEGLFYIWSYQQLEKHLSGDDLQLIEKYYQIKRHGNFSDEASGAPVDRNIFYLKENASVIDAFADERLRQLFNKLYQIRKARIWPLRDEKILTDQNAYVVSSLIKAARQIEDDHLKTQLINAATRVYCFLLNRRVICDAKGRDIPTHKANADNNKGGSGNPVFYAMDAESRLMHTDRHTGLLDDYGFMLQAALELYACHYDPVLLQHAAVFADNIIDRFKAEDGSFYQTAEEDRQTPQPTREIYDGAMPSGSGTALQCLVKLAHLTGEPQYSDAVSTAAKAIYHEIETHPEGYVNTIEALHRLYENRQLILLANNISTEQIEQFLEPVKNLDISVVLIDSQNKLSFLKQSFAMFEPYTMPGASQAAAYLCHNFTCDRPVYEPEQLIALLKNSA